MKCNEYFFAKQGSKSTSHDARACSSLQTKHQFKARNRLLFVTVEYIKDSLSPIANDLSLLNNQLL